MIRRILVALDASPDSLAAAAAAAELAALLEAELAGLFVEDIELLRLAESPLARQLDLLTASPRVAAAEDVERQLRVHAERARAELVRLADRAGIRWSFRVARGGVASEISAAAADADLVSLGRIGWTTRHKRALGTTVRALISQRGRVLLLERSVAIRPPIVVLYDGSDAARDALDLGTHLAGRRRDPLTVLLVGEDEERLRAEVEERLGEGSRVLWLGRPGAGAVAGAVSRQLGGVVLVPVGSLYLGEEHLQALLDEAPCPVLAVS